ncbi:MAG: DNA repair protein RecO [Minisyncoccota bacterium]
MAYHLYHTEAIVLRSVDTGESNRFYVLYTRDFGLVWALAQGVRELESKLRGHMKLWSVVDVTLVRGRALWRLTGAQESASCAGGRIATTPSTLGGAARISRLIERLVQGEGANGDLYQELFSALCFLYNNDFLVDNLDIFEAVCTARVLAHLGYGSEVPAPSLVLHSPWSNDVLKEAMESRSLIVRTINNALAASQL